MARRKIVTDTMPTFTSLLATISMGVSVYANKFGAGLSRHLSSSSFVNHSKTNSIFSQTSYARKMENRMASSHSLFPEEIHSTFSDSEMDDSSTTICTLLQRSRRIREKLYGDGSLPPFLLDSSLLGYPASAYNMDNNKILRNRGSKKSAQRGFCNWLIPQTIMIGQYPGMNPEFNGPSSKECQLHLQNMVQDAKISLFCCLQTEVPSQDDDIGWKSGEVYLESEYARREFPRPFTRYGPLAQSLTESQLTFLHNPIEDLNVPTCNDALLTLLSQLLGHLECEENRTIYLHCWGGRGRAGLIGSCLASLLFPELSSKEILDWVQGGYDTRSGAESMGEGLKRSPQTEQQRWFVREFVNSVHAERDGKEMSGK